MLILTAQRGITSDDGINDLLLNSQYRTIIVEKDGKCLAKMQYGVGYNEFPDFYSAMLKVSTNKSVLGRTRALNRIHKEIEEHSAKVIMLPEYSLRNLSLNMWNSDEKYYFAQRLKEVMRTFRPRTLEIGIAESFLNSRNMVQAEWKSDSYYEGLKTAGLRYSIPSCGTPVVRIGYGLLNNNIYSSNLEYIYIKL